MNRLNRKGFLLFELLAVIAAYIVFCYLCIHSFAWVDSLFVRLQLEQFCSTCYLQQQRAYTYRKERTILCDPIDNTFVLENETVQLPKQVRFGVFPHTKGPPAHPTKTISHPISFKNNTITCYANGGISSGTLYITDARAQRMYAMSNAVASHPFLRLYQYTTQWKQL